jgi:hypothetical protein
VCFVGVGGNGGVVTGFGACGRSGGFGICGIGKIVEHDQESNGRLSVLIEEIDRNSQPDQRLARYAAKWRAQSIPDSGQTLRIRAEQC